MLTRYADNGIELVSLAELVAFVPQLDALGCDDDALDDEIAVAAVIGQGTITLAALRHDLGLTEHENTCPDCHEPIGWDQIGAWCNACRWSERHG